jgi:hypothetical protein
MSVYVDLLISIGIVRDLFTIKRIHPVYLYGLPVMMVGQIIVIYILTTKWTLWMKIVNALCGGSGRGGSARLSSSNRTQSLVGIEPVSSCIGHGDRSIKLARARSA